MGVKPICNYHHKFEYTYLFGAFSPITGKSFMLDLPFCNAATFQIFLNEFSLENPKEFKIIFLDNGAFHKAKGLIIPENICLYFLPPYSPELNPAEKVWWVLKKETNLKVFKTIEALQRHVDKSIKKLLSEKAIVKLTSYKTYVRNYQTIM